MMGRQHDIPRRRGTRARVASTLLQATLGLATVAGTWAMAPAPARADELQRAECRVHAVLASKAEAPERIPGNLSFLRGELSSGQFTDFKSFRLLGSTDYTLTLGKTVTRDAAAGHRVGLGLRGGSRARPSLHVEVTSAGRAKPLVSANYSVKADGFLLLAGLRHPDGRLVLAVQCHGA